MDLNFHGYSPEQIAYAIWLDAGCGKWRPAPQEILRVEPKGVVYHVYTKCGMWPIAHWVLENLAQQLATK